MKRIAVGVRGAVSHTLVEPLLHHLVPGDAVGVLGARVGRSGRRLGDEQGLLRRVVGEEVDEVEVSVALLVGGGLEGVVDDAAASGVALDLEEVLGVGSLSGCVALVADVALD